MAGKSTATGVVLRALSQVYHQAMGSASKTGVAQETVQNMPVKSSKGMTEQEARKVFGITEKTSVEEMLKKYEDFFVKNAKSGSSYFQSAVHRAKEWLEAERSKGSRKV